MSESHSLMEGKLHVYRRENSPYWQCATYLSVTEKPLLKVRLSAS